VTVYRLRADGLSWREIAGETVVVDIPASVYLTANGSGTALWNELADGATREALIRTLVERYGVDADRAAGDVDRFLRTLAERDLLETSAGA
jgi:hypothetical protein